MLGVRSRAKGSSKVAGNISTRFHQLSMMRVMTDCPINSVYVNCIPENNESTNINKVNEYEIKRWVINNKKVKLDGRNKRAEMSQGETKYQRHTFIHPCMHSVIQHNLRRQNLEPSESLTGPFCRVLQEPKRLA